MAPSKSPVFAVCGSMSVETVVAASRRCTIKARRSSTASLAESLYADLLWECGGGNVEKVVVPVASSSSEQEDYADVFGGPPKFASLSAQISSKRRMAKVSDACNSGAVAFPASAMGDGMAAFDTFHDHPRVCMTQDGLRGSEVHALLSSSTKLRSEIEFSSRICYSDSDKKGFIKHKEETGFDEILTSASPRLGKGVKSSTVSRGKESSKSDVGEDVKDIRVPKPAKRGLARMKENIQTSSKGLVSKHEGQDAGAQTRMAHSSRIFQEASQKSTHPLHNMKIEGRRHNLEIKKQEITDDLWVTIKEVEFATEPSTYPAPTRPPPGLGSDITYASMATGEAMKHGDDLSKKCSQSPHKDFDSGSLIFSCTRKSHRKDVGNSRDVADAMEKAEAKIRMVLAAREKAKLMVERKFKEKQRARQHKDGDANEVKTGTEQFYKEHTRDLRERREKLKVHHCEDILDRQWPVEERKRDTTRQCFERATREVSALSAGGIQERVGESRASHDTSEQLVENRTHKVYAKFATPRTAGHFWVERTNVGLSKRCQIVGKEVDFVSREQQQAGICCKQSHLASMKHMVHPCSSPSSSWCDTKQRSFTEAASLERVISMPRTLDDLHEGFSSPVGFKEIVGETLERRKARWDRHCRTVARMAEALAVKQQRDLEWQKEQAERHRAGEVLDEEIWSWAAGKEGNLEALLSSLHYVLWPECGWERVLSADLSTAAAVKKAYRRATLCVHPDKVQQKGATVAQKYIAEKVFDLLKDAWVRYT